MIGRVVLHRAAFRRVATALMTLSAMALVAGCAHFAQPAKVERILVVGNSVVYRNDLPAHLAALASAARGVRVDVDMIAAGGRRIEQHAADGVVMREIESGRYRALVLQEWGGGLLCGEQQARFGFDCEASRAAHAALARAAQARGMRIVVLGTSQPIPELAHALATGEAALAAEIGALHVDLRAFPALRQRYPERLWMDADGAHPGPDQTLWMAASVARALYGDVRLAAPLRIVYRDYRGAFVPKAHSLASTQTVQAQQRSRALDARDPLLAVSSPRTADAAD